MKTIKNTIVTLLLLGLIYPAFSQGWECEECPERDIGLFDLDVWIENPAKSDSTDIGNKKYKDWVQLFMVAGGIHNTLFNNDPSKECLNYYDGQMTVISTIEDFDEQNYQHGNNTPSLPPPAGTVDAVDYWITGVIANQKSDGATIIKVYVNASGTGETAVEAIALYDYSISGIQNGENVAQQLLPLMEKIRDFEKKKREEEDQIAIGPYEGATLKLTPEKKEVEVGKTVNVTIELLDCDDVPLKNMNVVLSSEVSMSSRGGTFSPEEVTTDDTGRAKSKFKANNEPGTFAQPFEFDFRFPFSDKFNTAGDEGFITIKPADYEARITVTKNFNRVLRTTQEDAKKEHVEKRKLDESIEASATIYLSLTESQDMPIFNQTWKYYKPTSVSISSFNSRYKENMNRSGPNYVTNVDIVRFTKNYQLKGKEQVTQVPWILAIDNETEKAIKLIPGGYNISYEFQEKENMNSVIYTDDGPERDSKTTTKTGEKTFKLGPVAEEVTDPTIKKSDTWVQDYLKRQGIELPPGVPIPDISNEDTVKEIQPDILVKSGDGKNNFGGYGDRTIREDLGNGFQEDNLSYEWNMSIKKKK